MKPIHDHIPHTSTGKAMSLQPLESPVPHPGTTAPRKYTDNGSVVDSAYNSTAESSSNTTASYASRTSPPSESNRRRIPGTDLFLFRTGGNEEALRHYESISPTIEGLLCRSITELGYDPSCTMIMRLAVVGNTQENARFCLLVFGKPELEDSIRAFFGSASIAPLLNPGYIGVPNIPPIFIARDPALRCSVVDVGLCCPVPQSSATYCGFPIVLRASQASSGQTLTRKATFGGIIKIIDLQGDSQLYGITAGHAVQELLQHSEWPTASTALFASSSTDASVTSTYWHEKHTVGHILDHSQLPGVSAGRATPLYDWALFTTASPRPNQAHNAGKAAEMLNSSHDILAAEKPRFYSGVSDTVIILDGTSGTRHGEMSSLPARIWIAQSKSFVDAYSLELSYGISESRYILDRNAI